MGVAVAELGLPRDSSIVAVVRDQGVIVPRGDTALSAGDEVLLLVTEESEAEIRRLFIEKVDLSGA